MKITVVGTGYVGLSIAVLLSQKHYVTALDIDPDKVDKINSNKSPIVDTEIEKFLIEKKLNLRATLDKKIAYSNPRYVVIATPTDYDEKLNYFNTNSVDQTIEDISEYCPSAIIVLKSTLPIGYTEKIRLKYPQLQILFSPEFLREGKALLDNLYPSRIIVSDQYQTSFEFASLLQEASMKQDVQILHPGATEAEAIKLFSNTYLALRVAFFNELDTFSEIMNLDSEQIIKGIGLDPRIGLHYNNPSFGYGGYCLPKDTKQMVVNYESVPQNLMSAIVESNNTRKVYIANRIISYNPKIVGVYRLVMKSGSDNFRSSSILDVINHLKNAGITVIIYEPEISYDHFYEYRVVKDLIDFKNISDIIITNRHDSKLEDVKEKIYTRDIFNRD